ncbi:MAG: hypothetical protein AABY64_01690 [Bdellovibrionota bacterium]
MRGASKIPSPSDLVEYYKILQNSKIALAADVLSEIIQNTRWDPRLHEQVVTHIEIYWKSISALELNQSTLNQAWPACLGVTLETVLFILKNKDPLSAKDLVLFKNWMTLACTNIEPANQEVFYIGLNTFAGKEFKKDVHFTIQPFAKWGYFCQDLAVSKFKSEAKLENSNLYPVESRKNLLHKLFESKKRISVKDYLKIIEYSISQRQAERDLKMFSGVRAIGNTKNRTYSLHSKKNK